MRRTKLVFQYLFSIVFHARSMYKSSMYNRLNLIRENFKEIHRTFLL